MLSLVSIFVLLHLAIGQDPTLRLLGTRPIRLPGFNTVYVHDDASDPTEKFSLLVSTFLPVPLTRDETYFLEHVGKYMDDFSQAPLTVVSDQFIWPREPRQTPVDVFGFESITQPTGFLVPGKNRGSINVVDFRDYNNPLVYDIIQDPVDWFYHRALWIDCNGDGRKDAMTLRARSNSTSGGFQTEMLWLEHPESNIFDEPWKKHILNQGVVGMMLSETKLTRFGTEYSILVATGYFTQSLVMFWSSNGLWNDPDQIGRRVIDVGGQFFDVVIDDLNRDGRLDLLLGVNAEVNGSFVAYEIPEDFMFGEYKRHLIADGFNARSGVQNAGTPGMSSTFYPSVSVTGKPWLLLSGDDEGTAYYFIPKSQAVDDWSYEKVLFYDAGEGNTFGQFSTVDVNGDGYNEVFVTAYQQELLYLFTFAP